MPLRIKHEDELDKPVVVCDYCGKEIVNVREGNYQWETDDELLPVNGKVYFTHKWCCHPFEQSNRDKGWGAEELICLPPFLAGNLNLKLKDAERHVKMLIAVGNAR